MHRTTMVGAANLEQADDARAKFQGRACACKNEELHASQPNLAFPQRGAPGWSRAASAASRRHEWTCPPPACGPGRSVLQPAPAAALRSRSGAARPHLHRLLSSKRFLPCVQRTGKDRQGHQPLRFLCAKQSCQNIEHSQLAAVRSADKLLKQSRDELVLPHVNTHQVNRGSTQEKAAAASFDPWPRHSSRSTPSSSNGYASEQAAPAFLRTVFALARSATHSLASWTWTCDGAPGCTIRAVRR